MKRFCAVSLTLMLALVGFSVPAPAIATQVEGNTYTSQDYPYSLTWDDSWFLLEGPVFEAGAESLTLGNGTSIVLVIASEEAFGNAQFGLASVLVGFSSEPSISNVEPLTDAAGEEIRENGNTRSFAAVKYTQDIDGTPVDFAAYIETRTLVPETSIITILHITPLDLYESEAPVVQQLLTGLEIQEGGQPPSDEEGTPVAQEEITPAPTVEETPTPEPEPAEPPQAFVSTNWRITVVSAQRGATIDAVGLDEREGSEWVVVIADVTNWSDDAAELVPRDVELRFDDGRDPNRPAVRSTINVAEALDLDLDSIDEALPFDADETKRIPLVFLTDEDREGPALALRVSMPIDPVINGDVPLDDLPPVTELPDLVQASIDLYRHGRALDVTIEPDGDEAQITLLGVDAPRGDDCFSDESVDALEQLASDDVLIEFPEGSNEAAYVWVERPNGSHVLVNRQMVGGGFAAFDPADTGLFGSWLSTSQDSARDREIGLWEVCTGPHGISKEVAAEETAAAQIEPSPTPTEEPTATPTEEPTEEPTTTPTEEPTEAASPTPSSTAEVIETQVPREPGTPEAGPTESGGAMFRGDVARTGVQPGPGLGAPAEFPWQFSIGFPILSSPAVVDGTIFIGSLNTEVFALDSFSGPAKWNFKTGGEVLASPTVADGVVYIGSGDGNLYALDAETGRELWRFAATNAVSSSAAVVDGVVYFGSDDANLYAVDAVTGQEIWRSRIGPAFSSPAVVDGVLYIGAAQSVFAIDATSGEEVWRFQASSFLSSSPAVVDGAVFIGSDGGTLFSIDAATGDERWRMEAGDAIISSPAVVDGAVFVGSDDHFVYAIDADSGEERWKFETGDAVSASPAVAEGVVFIGSLDSFVYGLDAVTGTERWRAQVGPVFSSPAFVDDVLYVASADGTVYARQPFDVLGIPGLGGEPAPGDGTPDPGA
jgi:outer membrane protein assembly factor BamB